MLGTAFPAARLLLIEQPLPWGAEGLRSSGFPREGALALEARGRAAGVRVQAFRRPGRQSNGPRRQWAFVDTRDATSTLRAGTFTDAGELLELPLDGSAGVLDSAPLYLVCTHGKHDPCCALRGRPVVRALGSLRPGRVWQVSHLGGCRFAPTVLVLPLGLMYGRVPPSAVREIVTRSEAGEVDRARLRGRIGMPPAAQAAAAFAHERLALPRSRDVSFISNTALDAATVRVVLDTPEGPVAVIVRRERVDAAGLTCAAPGPSWFLAHHPVSIEPGDAV